MGGRTIWRSFILVLALLFMLGWVLPASSAIQTRVWVEFRPGEGASVRAELQKAGAAFHYQFDELNAFVVSLPESAISGLRRNPKVAAIEADPVRELVRNIPTQGMDVAETLLPEQVVPYGVDMVQARKIWDANSDGKIDKKAPTGAGRTVCIIDSGLYSAHEDFQGVNIIGGYSQVDSDPARWSNDGLGHGTHVAGTITAMNNSVGVVGVTPGTVSLFLVKIFDDTGAWVSKAHASDLAAAALLCTENGANIISMSLSGTHYSPYEEKIFNKIYAAGVLSVAAASNDGIEEYHYPASYDSVISVAAIDSSYMVADFSQHNDKVELAAPGVGVLSTVPFVALATLSVDDETFEGYHVEFAPYGSAAGMLVDGGRCLATGDWAGAVVLCERGDITFYEKVMNVQNSGGVAAVIYNNTTGVIYATLGEGNTSAIPAITILQEEGWYLVANKLGAQAVVSDTVTFPASGYEAWDGTSMATPHVSAVAALIWSWKPELTNVQIRQALQATAMDLGDPGRDTYYGYGLVQAYDAWVYLGGGKPGKK